MVLFSKEFGSKDPFLDAIQTARFMVERDALAFCPHIGIAGGKVAVGYVGTPLKYNCSVFGRPVAIASRCSSIKPKGDGSTSIIFPSNLVKIKTLIKYLLNYLKILFPIKTYLGKFFRLEMKKLKTCQILKLLR